MYAGSPCIKIRTALDPIVPEVSVSKLCPCHCSWIGYRIGKCGLKIEMVLVDVFFLGV